MPRRRGRIRYQESPAERVFSVGNVLFMLALMGVTVYPLVYVFFASLSNATELTTHRGLLFAPLDITFEAYRRVFQNPIILTGYPICGAASATPSEAARVSSRSWMRSCNAGSVRQTGTVGRLRMGSGYRRMGRTATTRVGRSRWAVG